MISSFHPFCSQSQDPIPCYSQPYPTAPVHQVFVHPSVDAEVVSVSWLLGMVLQRTGECGCLLDGLISFPLRIYLGRVSGAYRVGSREQRGAVEDEGAAVRVWPHLGAEASLGGPCPG